MQSFLEIVENIGAWVAVAALFFLLANVVIAIARGRRLMYRFPAMKFFGIIFFIGATVSFIAYKALDFMRP